MPEQFQVAAVRHFDTAEKLAAIGLIDDAAYHLGICGETAFKHAMQESGMEAHYRTVGAAILTTPMRGHWGALADKISAAAADISLFAQGRRAAALYNLAQMNPITHFSGWSIDIRYADTACVPVSRVNHQAWHNDATDYLLNFAL